MSSTDRLSDPAADQSPAAPPAAADESPGVCPVRHETVSSGEAAVCPAGVNPAANAFSISMMVSGIRCLLTYIVFPWALPLLGLAAGVGTAIGLVFGLLAIGSNVLSIRRMWATDWKWKWPITVINVGVIVLLLVLIGLDVSDLA